MKFSDVLFVPLPLSAADAYWHACTGTPVEVEVAPLRTDRDAPVGNIYFISKWNVDDTVESWARRVGVVHNVAP